jgi:uncharacterized protein (TIGR02996 family)
MSLDRALALVGTDPAGALRALIFAWQANRAPEIAELVDRLDARFAAARPKLAGGADVAELARAVRARDLTDAGRILAAPPYRPTYRDERMRWRQLPKQLGADPRITAALVGRLSRSFVNDHPYLWSVLAKVLDPRTLPRLRELAGESRGWYKNQYETLIKRIEKVAPAPLSAAEEALVAKIGAAIAKTDAKLEKTSARRVVAKESGDLDGALASIASDPARALPGLLTAWRATPDPALADLIARVSARIARPALPTQPVTGLMAAWLSCETAGDPADVDRLLAPLRLGLVKDVSERLAVLARRPADPRIAAAAMSIFVEQPFTAQTSRPLYTAAARLVEAMRDPRAVASIDATIAKIPRGARALAFHGFLAEKLARLRKIVASFTDATLAGDVAKRVAQAAPVATDDEPRLLAAIWAAPGDDAPRQVYADWLQERGRPHGEFIALQLAAGARGSKAGRRERELIDAHARDFLGPLAPALQLRNLRFERGFVVHAEITSKRSPTVDEIAEHPAWSTLESFAAHYLLRRFHPRLFARLQKLGIPRLQKR